MAIVLLTIVVRCETHESMLRQGPILAYQVSMPDFSMTQTELVSDAPLSGLANVAPRYAKGDIIGGCYELRELLGTGGMGLVYEAHDHALNRTIAIKLAKSTTFAEPLAREARIMAAFQHPGLPTVYAMGTHEGYPYVVMERLRGRSLSEHIEHVQATFSVDETRYLMLSIISSLRILHRAQVAHRDIKPSNIMIVPPDRVVLLDFGTSDMERYVSTSSIVGSPHYMAPEVTIGTIEPGRAHLTDVYALGVIGFRMLTGRKPFDGDNIAELATKHLTHEVPHTARVVPRYTQTNGRCDHGDAG